eukprot:g6154.t1
MNISLCRARGVYKYIQQVLKCYYIRRATVVCVVTILMPRTAFIVGASRGIGKGLVEVFSKAGWSVHATVRNLDNISFPDNVVTHILDVEKEEQIREVANSSKLHNVSIDLFIHNAGVKPSSSISDEQCLNINTVAPFHVIDAFMAKIVHSESQKKICLMSSMMGSREISGGGSTPRNTYGKSKCYLNDKFREIEPSWREKGITSIVLHPGWVSTDMGGPSAPVTVEDSTDGIYKVCVMMDAGFSGKFYTYEGKEHPW